MAPSALFIQNRLNYDGFAPELEVGRILFLLSIPVAVLSILIQPTVGSISDYTVSRWGRRKPYIVFGSLLDLVFLAGIATANNVADPRRLRGAAGDQHEHRPRAVPGLRARTSSRERQVGHGQRARRADADPRQRDRLPAVTIAVALGRMELAIAAVAIVELVTMVAVVVRVQPRPAAARPGTGGHGPRSPARPGARTSSSERSYVWLVVSRLFFLMGGAMLVNLVITYLKQTHGLTRRPPTGRTRSCWSSSWSRNLSRSSRAPGSPIGSGASP